MEEKILAEIQGIRSLMAKIVGTENKPREMQFSSESLDKAAQEFTKMTIERGDWIKEDDFSRYLGSCPMSAGRFIIEAFSFNHYIRKGRQFLYFKEDIITLGQELKARNIDLKRYKEFQDDKANFEKKVAAAASTEKKGAKRKRFQFPPGLKNITTSDIPKPDPELVRQDLAILRKEFTQGKYQAYIDVYRGAHAMLKFIYHFERYLEPGQKQRCRKWCERFNYANHALELITGKKQKFVEGDPAIIEL